MPLREEVKSNSLLYSLRHFPVTCLHERLRVCKVPVSYIGLWTAYVDDVFAWFSSLPPGNIRDSRPASRQATAASFTSVAVYFTQTDTLFDSVKS